MRCDRTPISLVVSSGEQDHTMRACGPLGTRCGILRAPWAPSLSSVDRSNARLEVLRHGRFLWICLAGAVGSPITRWAPELARMRVLRHAEGPVHETDEAIRPITFRDLLTRRSGLTYGDFSSRSGQKHVCGGARRADRTCGRGCGPGAAKRPRARPRRDRRVTHGGLEDRSQATPPLPEPLTRRHRSWDPSAQCRTAAQTSRG